MPTATTPAALALAAALTLAGCSGLSGAAPHISGDVIQRDHERARTTTGTCYRTKYTRTGKRSTTRRVPYSCTTTRNASWKIRVRTDDGATRWMTVPQHVYRDCTIGDRYEADERDC